MTWTRLSDDWPDKPQILAVSRSARLLHIEALVYCNRQETDGFLPAAMLRRITDAEPVADLVAQLLDAELWCEADGGYEVDWSDQETRERLEERRRANADKQTAYRLRKTLHARGDHSRCSPQFCPDLMTGRVTGNATGLVTGPRPDPTLPDPSRPPQGQGQGQEDDAERAGGASTIAPAGQGCASCGHHAFADGECMRCSHPREEAS